MRRGLAAALLATICGLMIAPALLADPESQLPECCRRKGAHHCAMRAESQASSSGSAVYAPSRCSSFPLTTAGPITGNASFLTSSMATSAGFVTAPAVQSQVEARYRVSFSRTRQKRGPPAFLS